MTGPVILALDASRAACSVAVMIGGAVVSEEGAAMVRGQAEALMPMIARVLAAAGIRAGDASAIAVPVGPGSFTGIRIALSAARGLALATGADLIGIDGFRVALEAAHAGRPAIVAIESGRGDWFVRRFGRDRTDDTAPAQMNAAGIAALSPAQDFDFVAPKDLLDAIGVAAKSRHRPADLAGLATAALRIAARILRDGGKGEDGAALPARPLYVAPPAVTMPLPSR